MNTTPATSTSNHARAHRAGLRLRGDANHSADVHAETDLRTVLQMLEAYGRDYDRAAGLYGVLFPAQPLPRTFTKIVDAFVSEIVQLRQTQEPRP